MLIPFLWLACDVDLYVGPLEAIFSGTTTPILRNVFFCNSPGTKLNMYKYFVF